MRRNQMGDGQGGGGVWRGEMTIEDRVVRLSPDESSL